MPSQDTPAKVEKPWVAHGSFSAEHEDFIVGNKEGLGVLRSSIDQALADGESKIQDGGIEFVGVRVIEQDPRLGVSPEGKRKKDAVALWGCGLAAFVVIFIILAGLFQIWNWIK